MSMGDMLFAAGWRGLAGIYTVKSRSLFEAAPRCLSDSAKSSTPNGAGEPENAHHSRKSVKKMSRSGPQNREKPRCLGIMGVLLGRSVKPKHQTQEARVMLLEKERQYCRCCFREDVHKPVGVSAITSFLLVVSAGLFFVIWPYRCLTCGTLRVRRLIPEFRKAQRSVLR